MLCHSAVDNILPLSASYIIFLCQQGCVALFVMVFFFSASWYHLLSCNNLPVITAQVSIGTTLLPPLYIPGEYMLHYARKS